MRIKLFADGADKEGIREMEKNPDIKGFTTNPTLMRKSGIRNYLSFAKEILEIVKDKPISFEVFADEFEEMERQALLISSWGKNVFVKIPVMNTKRKFSYELIEKLSKSGVNVNITAIMTLEQIKKISEAVIGGGNCIFSVFAGRIADTGIDPIPIMKEALILIKNLNNVELLWASPREVLNVYQAEAIGCDIITATNDILRKINLKGKDLNDYSHETVKMFYSDAKSAGFEL